MGYSKEISQSKTHIQRERPVTMKQLLQKYDEHEIDALLDNCGIAEVPRSDRAKGLVMHVDHGKLGARLDDYPQQNLEGWRKEALPR